MKVVTVTAKPRDPGGKSVARRMRRNGELPGVVYGEGREPRHISVGMHQFSQALAGGARVLDLELDGVGASRVLLKDLQYDAMGRRLVHADFLRLHPDHKLELAVPIDFIGTPVGVAAGGILMVVQDNVTVRCLPRHIPERLEYELTPLELGATLHASDIALPDEVELAGDPNAVVVNVVVPRGQADDDAGDGESDAEAEAVEGAPPVA